MFRVADCLDVNGSRVLVDCFVKFCGVVSDHPFDVNLKLAQIHTELVETATVYYGDEALRLVCLVSSQISCNLRLTPTSTDEVVAGFTALGQGHKLRLPISIGK